MDFTWYHVIELVKIMRGWTQAQIAIALGVSTTTISRLKNDNSRKTPRLLSYQDIYRKLFLPCFEDPLDQKKSINEVKRGLIKIECESIIKDLDDSSCESFVVSLLQMADGSRSKDDILQRSPSDKESTKGVSSQNAPSLIKMPKEREPLHFSHRKSVNDFLNKVFSSEEIPDALWTNKPKHTDSSDDAASIPEVSADNPHTKPPTKTDATQKDDVASSSQASEQGKQPSGPANVIG